MQDEQRPPLQQKRIPYRKEIRIVIKGSAPEPKDQTKYGSEPYLPISYFEYIQNVTTTYKRNFEQDGLFIVEELSINDLEV